MTGTPTSLYVYGVTTYAPAGMARTAVEEVGPGVGGHKVELMIDEGLAAWVSLFDDTRARATRANLSAHQRVVENARGFGTILPVRFGTVMVDEGCVRADLLRGRGEELSALAAELDGYLEYRVKAAYQVEVALREAVGANMALGRLRNKLRSAPAGGGLQDRLRLGRMVAGALEELKARDGATVLAHLRPWRPAQLASGAGDVVVSAAVLVHAHDEATFQHALEQLSGELAGRINLEIVGPLAPWDFVNLYPVPPMAVAGR